LLTEWSCSLSALDAALEDPGLIAGFVLVVILIEGSQRQGHEECNLDARC